MEILRQNVGIDIGKDTFVATLTVLLPGQEIKHLRTKTFQNTPKEIKGFYLWVKKNKPDTCEINFTMEATGVYYENLAYYLFGKKETVHVLLPNKAKRFAESLNIKSKTDKIDSKILGRMGVERKLMKWEMSSKIYRKMRVLTRERKQLVKEITRVKNQLHAEGHTAEPLKSTMRRMRSLIKFLEKQKDKIEQELKKLVNTDEELAKKIDKITTVPGLRFITVAGIIAETQGFSNITSIKQLTSYAGYDVRIKQSGKWKGKPTISKIGNKHIRGALFLPALSIKTHTETYGRFYDRINEKKQNGLITGTAVQRKLLGLIYTLWKNDTSFIDNYQKQKVLD